MTIQNNKHAYIDPVCQMKITTPGEVRSFTFHSDTYHFCAEACREAFISDPDKYLQTELPTKKGLWARYLDRLNKATGGKPPCCH